MSNAIVIVAIIMIAIVAIVGFTIMGLCIHKLYDLMADTNRQAQLLVSEAIERERIAMHEYEEALKDREPSKQNEIIPYQQEEDEEAFNPHEYVVPR